MQRYLEHPFFESTAFGHLGEEAGFFHDRHSIRAESLLEEYLRKETAGRARGRAVTGTS